MTTGTASGPGRSGGTYNATGLPVSRLAKLLSDFPTPVLKPRRVGKGESPAQ